VSSISSVASRSVSLMHYRLTKRGLVCRCETLGVGLWGWRSNVSVCNVSIHYSFCVYRIIRIGSCCRRGSSFLSHLPPGRCGVKYVSCRAISLWWKFLFASFIFVDSSGKESSAAVCSSQLYYQYGKRRRRNDRSKGDYIASLCLCRAVKGKIHNKLLSTGTIS